MITTIVFDLDDTLYDELEYCKSGFDAVAHFLAESCEGLTTNRIFESLWKQFSAGNHTKTFNAALDELGLKYDDKIISSAVGVYRNHTPKIKLPKESEDVLRQLSRKYTPALLTDGFLPAQRLKVRALGIEKYFKCIIYTEEMGRQCWKPSPAGFEKLMRKLNVKPANCVYVADNAKKDFIAPKKLGFVTIQLIRPARLHTEASENADSVPQYVIDEMGELPALLEKI
jgi:putative hydrolase of the HAD superfamily